MKTQKTIETNRIALSTVAPETPGRRPGTRSQQAHASCYCMARSHVLGEGGWKTGSSQITVKGTVPGIDETAFKKAAEDAKDGCPISNAFKGNVELSVEGTLA